MKYAVAYEIFASQMLRANFISLSALAENFIIRQDYFISHSDISLLEELLLFQFYSPCGELYCFAVLLCFAKCYSLREFIGE